MDSPTHALKVDPLPAFADNYLWLLVRGTDAAVVDPGDAAPVEAALADRGLTLRAILLTHHHADHTGGVGPLLAARGAGTVAVYGPRDEAIVGITRPVGEGDRIAVDALGLTADVVDVPGHTRGHIAYVARSTDAPRRAPLLFCGDTLFAGGCGRLFEGTPAQMHDSLAKLAALPPETEVYCAHEYTLSNLRFAREVEPDSDALAARIADATALRGRDRPTLPSTIGLERATNPFLRVEHDGVRAAAERHAPGAAASPVATFAALRSWKDHYR